MNRFLTLLIMGLGLGALPAAADHNPTFIPTVSSVTALAALSGTQYPYVNVTGWNAGTTIGGGLFAYVAGGSPSNDHCNVFVVSGGAYVRQTGHTNRISAAECGAVPNNIGTDYTQNIKWALAAAAAANGNSSYPWGVLIPNGEYQLTSQLVVPGGVNVDCDNGPRWCSFVVQSAFTNLDTTGAIRIGNGTAAIYDTEVQHIQVDLAGISDANSVAFYTSDCQDRCGFQYDFARAYGGYGFKYDGSGGTFGSVNTGDMIDDEAERNESYAGDGNGIAFYIKNGTYPLHIRNLDAHCSNPATAACFLDGLYISNAPAPIQALTMEGHATNGVYVASDALAVTIVGATCSNITNCININSTNSVQAQGITSLNSFTYSILDAGGGSFSAFNLNDASVGLYSRSDPTYFNGPARAVDALEVDGNSSLQGVVVLPNISTSPPVTHCALWNNAGAVNVTTCP